MSSSENNRDGNTFAVSEAYMIGNIELDSGTLGNVMDVCSLLIHDRLIMVSTAFRSSSGSIISLA
jgi:hypothetical protein